MAQKINPPQFDENERDDIRLYKMRQFVEDVIRANDQLSNDLDAAGGGGGGSGGGSGGYPAQLGYAGVR